MTNINDTTSPMAHPICPSQPPPSDQTKQDPVSLSDQEQEASLISDKKDQALSEEKPKPKPKQKLNQEEDQRGDSSGRERLTKHRREIAGRVWIPEIWGQEELLKDWIDCSTFDTCLVPNGISSARAALVEEARRATSASGGLQRLNNRCLILR